ncbi:MAG: Hsp20/alpha crystallin family protein [Firmicutes bacterium]|nr:Hsp20/alpha crystallin family protein [Bacillota bacterium]
MFMPTLFRDDLFDDFFDDFGRRGTQASMTPVTLMKTDIQEKDNGYQLDIELPGCTKDNVSAELKDGYLNVKAEITQDNNEGEENSSYIRRERFYGTCSRSFYVGEDLTEQDITAKFENGVLKLFVPKKEAQPKVEQKKLIAIE